MRATPFSVRPASANAAPGSVNKRSEILRLASATPSTSLSNAATIDCETRLHSEEPKKPQESQGAKGECANKENNKETKTSACGFNVEKCNDRQVSASC